MLLRRTGSAPRQEGPAHDRPDVFLSYSRVDKEFAEGRLAKALAEHGKDVWIDVEDIRGGAADWRATVLTGIEAAKVVVFVLTPDSLASTVCREELAEAERLNKRIVPLLHGAVKGLDIPPALSKPNWVSARPEDDFGTSVEALIEAIELDEPWVAQHARLTQRTGEWLRHDRDGSYLLRGSDLRDAERWLDDQAGHDEAPTTDQITYITASRRAAARRQRGLLAGVALALLITAALAIAALVQRQRAIDREQTARAQARAAQSIAALSRDPEEAVDDALAAVAIRPNLAEARYALRRAVSSAGWKSILRLPDSRDVGLQDLEFSDDGRRVATGSSDGRVAIWDTRTGRLVARARTGGGVNTVQFSPDGRQLLTASDGPFARTFDSSTGELLQTFDTKSEKVWAATWGANGRRILTATVAGGALWDAASGSRLRPLHTDVNSGYAGAIKMSLDGRRALTAGQNGNAWLWDLAGSGKKPALVPGKGDGSPLAFTLFSRDGRRFVTAYASGAFCVWLAEGRTAPRCATRKPVASTDWDFSRDGRRVLQVGSTSGDVIVWDVQGAAPRRIADLEKGGSANSAQFSRDGDYIVTSGDDGLARIWQVQPTRLVALLHGHTRGVRRARFSPDGALVATVSDDGSGRLWSARPRTPTDPGWQSADSTSFSPDSRDVLVVQGKRRAIWNTGTGTVVELDEGGNQMSNFLDWPCGHAGGCSPWSPLGGLVAGANAKGGAVVWNPRTGRVVHHYGKETGTVREAALSPDGRRVVVVDANRPTAQIWDVETEKRVGDPVPSGAGEDALLLSAQFLANPPRILTVDILGKVRISDPTTGRSVTLPGAAYPPAVGTTVDGRVALGSQDGFLRTFSAAGEAAPPQRATDSSVSSLEFSPAGGAIALGGQTGTASIWRARTLGATQLRAFGGQITGTTFSPAGDFVLVTSGSTARLWDRSLRRVLTDLPATGNVRAEFSPDGSKIVIAGTKRLEVLPCIPCLPLEKLEERARSLLPAG